MLNNENQNLTDIESIKNLYPDIFDAMSSPDTSLIIDGIIDKYELEKPEEIEEKIKEVKTLKEVLEITKNLPGTKIVKILTQVFLGKLHPKDLYKIIQEELKLEEDLSHNVAKDIDDLMFSKIRLSLNKLYSTEEKFPSKISEKPEGKVSLEEPAPKKPDTYRESIE